MRPAWAIWALVIAAAIQLVVTLLPDAYSIVGPYFLVDGPMALRALESIVPFGLAAAILVGADRWSEGKSYLWRGAAALAFVGLTRLLSDAIWAAWDPSAAPPSNATQIALPALFAAGSAAFAVSMWLLAAGLRATGAASDPAPWRTALRGPGVLLLAAVGAVCAAATAWTAFPPSGTPAEAVPVAVVSAVLVAVGIATLAVLAVVAVRIRPPSGALPELLIAIGSTAAMVGLAGQWVVPWVFVAGWPPEVVFLLTLVGWTRALGFVVLAAGFLTAAGTEHAGTVEPA